MFKTFNGTVYLDGSFEYPQRVPRRCFCCGSSLIFVFHACLCYINAVMLSSLLLAALRSHACVLCFLVFCHFPIWCSGSGVVLDCIDS